MAKNLKITLRLVYIACALLVVTTAAGLLWLNLLNYFLKQAGNEIPMAAPLSALLGLLVIATCAHLVHAARTQLSAVTSQLRAE